MLMAAMFGESEYAIETNTCVQQTYSGSTLLTAAAKRKPREQQQGVQSVEIGLRLAEALAGSPSAGMTLSQIAKATDMTASKAHRYLVSLCRVGIAEQDVRSGRYALSWAAIHLGRRAQLGVPYLSGLDPVLKELHRLCRLPVAAAVWTGRGPVIIRKSEAASPLMIDTRIGARLPLIQSSIGRLFAAYLSPDQTAPLLKEEMASPEMSIVRGRRIGRTELDDILQEVREAGIASQHGDLITGIEAIAAPVFDPDDRIVMSLSIVSLIGRDDLSPEGEFATELRKAAGELSSNLRQRG